MKFPGFRPKPLTYKKSALVRFTSPSSRGLCSIPTVTARAWWHFKRIVVFSTRSASFTVRGTPQPLTLQRLRRIQYRRKLTLNATCTVSGGNRFCSFFYSSIRRYIKSTCAVRPLTWFRETMKCITSDIIFFRFSLLLCSTVILCNHLAIRHCQELGIGDWNQFNRITIKCAYHAVVTHSVSVEVYFCAFSPFPLIFRKMIEK